jgi:hypothetical protein
MHNTKKDCLVDLTKKQSMIEACKTNAKKLFIQEKIKKYN